MTGAHKKMQGTQCFLWPPGPDYVTHLIAYLVNTTLNV